MEIVKRRKKQTDNLTIAIINLFFAICLLSILLVCLCFADITYAGKTIVSLKLPNDIMLIIGIFLMILIYNTVNTFKKEITFKKSIILVIVSICFLFLQVLFVYNYYFITAWDTGYIIPASMAAAHGKSLEQWTEPLSMYPNNLFLVYIYSRIIKYLIIVGFGDYAYFALLVFQCIINWLVGLFLFDIMITLKHNFCLALFAYVLYIILVGLSPWVSIPYSDSVALFFPTLILAIYVKQFSGVFCTNIKWFIIAFLSYMGYRIKPQVLIITIAIICVHLSLILLEHKFNKNVIKKFISFFCGLICSFLIVNYMCSTLNINLNESKRYSFPHFFMMGMNVESMGVWSSEDVNYSYEFDSVSERDKHNLLKAKERIEEMGMLGLAKHLCRKTLTNYNDGTFCWGGEGSFYKEILSEKNSIISPFLRNIYYNRECQGKYYVIWSHFEQIVWIAVLLLTVLNVSLSSKDHKNAVMMLSIIGLTVFELLFEARARYLFIYVPIYIVLAAQGIVKLCDAISWLKSRISSRV